ncbi:MAG: flagellar hook assembly protein FlgD [Bacteriovoracaceae bacterium]|nr:flagellar hook assembly protein FlgD [Bacteriovoracaceae bacterium]
MPGIGKPKQANPFKNVQMNMGQRSGKKKNTKDIGAELNRMAGVETEARFVDKDKHNKMGKDSFLKLLTHQLQNQDPLKPMDQKQFAADLAQFAQLEQMTNMNSKFDKMQEAMPTENKFYGASFIGKEIYTKGTSIRVEENGKRIDVPFNLPQSAKKVMLRLYDSNNQLVGQVNRDSMGFGPQSISWDAKGFDDYFVGKGDYRVEVRAWDEGYNEFAGETKSSGTVQGVDFIGGETILTVDGGKKVYLRDVDSFKAPGSKKNKNTSASKLPALQKKADDSYNQIKLNQM